MEHGLYNHIYYFIIIMYHSTLLFMHKQQYGFCVSTFIHPYLSRAGFELGSLELQAIMLPIVPPLLVLESNKSKTLFR